VVPLRPLADWSECLAFSRGIADAIVAHDPERYTTRFAKAGRERKILIDYLRNNRTNTSVAAFSTRATPNAPVSMPLSWAMLTRRVTPDAFTVETVPARLARLRRDPWAGYWTSRQRLTPAMAKAFRAL
jgi:bifunctional non-homologous end joining protein LigD